MKNSVIVKVRSEVKMAQRYVKFDEIVLPIFDGSEYVHWKRRLLKFLEFKKCKCVVE